MTDLSDTEIIAVQPWYQTAHAQITEPTRFVAFSQYYRQRWMREVGPVGTAILLELRGRCYNNPHTGECRNTIVSSQRELAAAIGVSVDTLQRQLGRPGREADPKANWALRRFVWVEERYERGDGGRVRQLENVYHVAMDDPIHPSDEARLAALMQQYQAAERTEQERQRTGRKKILSAKPQPPAPEAPDSRSSRKDSTSKIRTATSKSDAVKSKPPEPQFAVLRERGAESASPGPQFAVGGHRKLRQGLPQFAALYKESSLPFFTRIITTSLNVSDCGGEGTAGAQTPPTHNGQEVGLKTSLFEETAVSSEPCAESPTPLPRGKLRGMAALKAQEVARVVRLTGDAGSERRFRQLLDVAWGAGCDDAWRAACRATEIRLSREEEALARPGAYFCTVLVNLLMEQGVAAPVGDSEERAAVARLARQSLGLPES